MTVTPEHVREAVKSGKITPQEGAFYLEQEYHKPRRRRVIAAIIILFAVAFASVLFMPGDQTPIGHVVLDIAGLHNQSNVTIAQSATRIAVSGTLYGEGNASVWYDTPGGSLLVARVTSDDGTPRTDKAGYAVGDPVNVEHAPLDATYYLDDGTTSAAISVPFSAPSADATLLIVANASGTLTTYKLPIRIGDLPRTTAFSDVCVETCAMNATNGTLRVETTPDARLELSGAAADVQAPNHPPTNIAALPVLDVNSTMEMDLAPYFRDADGDALYYSVSTGVHADLAINGSVLTVTPVTSGTETITIYVSDLKDLVPTEMTIVVTMPDASVNATNATNETPVVNETTNGTVGINTTGNDTVNTTADVNASINITENSTLNITDNTTLNSSYNITTDCSDPDPNMRPLECLQNGTTNYFPEQDIFWYDTNRDAVARFTPLGNLMLTGDVVALSNGTPQQGAFIIGHENADGAIIATIWVDGAGNLQLRGSVHEENGNLQPAPGSYSFNNRKGITLAYADAQTGDLYLRGNVIPYRRSLT